MSVQIGEAIGSSDLVHTCTRKVGVLSQSCCSGELSFVVSPNCFADSLLGKAGGGAVRLSRPPRVYTAVVVS